MASDRLTDQPPASALHDLWEAAWRRKYHVLLGVVVGLALGVLFYAMWPRTYESLAQILVMKKTPDTPLSSSDPASRVLGASPNLVEDFLETHKTVIRSSVVIDNAIAKGHLADLATFRQSERPAKDLLRSLTVSRGDRDKRPTTSQILNVTFRAGEPEDCTAVVGSVVASYRDFLTNTTQNSAREALELITKARNILENDLDQKEKSYAEFRRNTPVLWKTQYGTTLYQERLAIIDAQRSALAVRKAQIRATLDAVDAAVKQGRSRAELMDLVSASLARSTVTLRQPGGQPTALRPSADGEPGGHSQSALEPELIRLQLLERRLMEEWGPKHPEVLSVREQLQTLRGLLVPSTAPADKIPEQRKSELVVREQMVDLKIGQLKQELDDLQRNAASLDALFATELQEAKKVFPYETQDEIFRRQIERSQLLYENIVKRLKELDLTNNFGGYDTQVITPPTEAEKVAPRGVFVFPTSLLLGLLLGAGLAYLAESTDKSFRSAEEIRRRLGLPVMSCIPAIKPDSLAVRPGNAMGAAREATLDPVLTAFHRPKSKEAEAFRAVRTALYFSTRGSECKVVQVTSPNMRDGKSTLAANLALVIAQSGKRVLLVDADLRRPRVHRLFGVGDAVGFSSVLQGLAEPTEAIVPTAVPDLWVLPCGPLPANPAELLTATRFPELLQWMRERYDYVLVDTPPLLAVTDPSVVAPRVDGVILTLRPQNSRVAALRAKEVLANLNVNVFGLVVNTGEMGKESTEYGYYNADYYREDEEGKGETGNSAEGPGGRLVAAEKTVAPASDGPPTPGA